MAARRNLTENFLLIFSNSSRFGRSGRCGLSPLYRATFFSELFCIPERLLQGTIGVSRTSCLSQGRADGTAPNIEPLLSNLPLTRIVGGGTDCRILCERTDSLLFSFLHYTNQANIALSHTQRALILAVLPLDFQGQIILIGPCVMLFHESIKH